MSSCSSLYPVLHGDSRWATSLSSSLSPPPHLPPSSSFSSSSSLFLKGFNTELEELHKVQQNWSIPDPHLRARIRGDNVEIVAPVYAEFYRVWVMHGSRMSECASIRIIIQARDGKCPWTKLCSDSIFFSRHAKMNFTKNPDKYLKYSPDSLDSKLRSFFDGGVWIWSVEN